MSNNEKAPTPALPRKREREHTPLLSSLSRLRGEGGALVRARRVGAASIEISRHDPEPYDSGSIRFADRPE